MIRTIDASQSKYSPKQTNSNEMSVQYFRFTQAVTGPRGKGNRLLKW